MWHRYPNPDSRSLPPLYVPTPTFLIAIALIVIGASLGLAWFLSHQPLEPEREVRSFAEIVGPDCGGADDVWECMVGAGE